MFSILYEQVLFMRMYMHYILEATAIEKKKQYKRRFLFIR